MTGNTAALGSASRDWCRVGGAGADARGVERRGAALSHRHGGSLGGVPVIEVAERYGVSRKTVHAWLRRYRQDGLSGLTDRSHRPHRHPGQLAAEIEARVCELRRTHPRWGPRRLVHELCRLGVTPVPSRSTVYRVLVRHSLVTAIPRKRRRQDYRRYGPDAEYVLRWRPLSQPPAWLPWPARPLRRLTLRQAANQLVSSARLMLDDSGAAFNDSAPGLPGWGTARC